MHLKVVMLKFYSFAITDCGCGIDSVKIWSITSPMCPLRRQYRHKPRLIGTAQREHHQSVQKLVIYRAAQERDTYDNNDANRSSRVTKRSKGWCVFGFEIYI